MFLSCLPPFTPRVVFGRKAAPFQFQTSGRREQVFVSLSMKNYLKNQPPATRGFSLINAEGFRVAQERGKRKQQSGNKQTFGLPGKWQISSPWPGSESSASPRLRRPSPAPALPNTSKISNSSRRFPSPPPARGYIWYLNTQEWLGRGYQKKKLKCSIQAVGRRVVYSLWQILAECRASRRAGFLWKGGGCA